MLRRIALTARVFGELGAFMVILKVRGFNGVRAWVQACAVVPTAERGDQVIPLVTHAVDRACMYSPVHMACLARAAMATRVLRRYGFHASLVVGVQRMPFMAHAWVTLDGKPIYGLLDGSSCLRVIDRF